MASLSGYQQWKRAAKRLIDGLPEDGATIIVATNAVGRHLKRGITERRGRALARKCKAISVHWMADSDKLSGLQGAVVIDHSFGSHARPDVRMRVEAMIGAVDLNKVGTNVHAPRTCLAMQGQGGGNP